MKKVFKFATGEEIPRGAVYLSTKVEKEILVKKREGTYHSLDIEEHTEKNVLVWHYFLVEVGKFK